MLKLREANKKVAATTHPTFKRSSSLNAPIQPVKDEKDENKSNSDTPPASTRDRQPFRKPTYPESDSDPDNEDKPRKLYCICQKEYNTDVTMFYCEGPCH